MRKPRLNDQQVHAFLESLFEEDLHAKRILSLSYAVLGVIFPLQARLRILPGHSHDAGRQTSAPDGSIR
ncbi:hypothetical protein DAT35_56675 [Vitiosangium sp. GDMCC 1.1324]|nr:hypothetical protein DAT35_56675 [Vitiosangium sp. GDMCC 1.1324]